MTRFLAFWLILLAALLPPAQCHAAPDDEEQVVEAEANGQFEIAEANFDQWVFQGVGNAEAGRKRISSWLTLQLEEVDRLCGLTDEQKLKLTLAAGGDVKRFFEEVETLREKFMKVRNDQNAFGQLWQEIQPLQMKQAAGLFGGRSLFAKTLRKTLSPEQFAKYAAVQEERRKFRYQASVEVSLVTLESTIPLRRSQREAILKLLLENTSPPLAFGQQDHQFVLYQLANLPQKEIKELLDQRQWKLLSQQLAGHKNMKQFLVQNGVMAKEGEEDEWAQTPRNHKPD